MKKYKFNFKKIKGPFICKLMNGKKISSTYLLIGTTYRQIQIDSQCGKLFRSDSNAN